MYSVNWPMFDLTFFGTIANKNSTVSNENTATVWVPVKLHC